MRYFKFFPILLGIILLTSWVGVFKSFQNQNPDLAFMRDAASSGLFEVAAGRLAQQKGTSQQVKTFAQQMITDHGKANQELKALAAQKKITLDTMDAQKQQLYMNLAKKSGAEFDKAYVSEMVRAHDLDVSKFNEAIKGLADSDVKGWASKTLPTLKTHQQHAHHMRQAMNKKQ